VINPQAIVTTPQTRGAMLFNLRGLISFKAGTALHVTP
jgi:hypothetical protein